MAFNMNGSPLNKLNLFRKGRGKEYRQTKKAIKKAVKETGGFVATEGEGGGWNVSGAAGGGTGNIYKGGQSARRLARSAAEAMTSGIDKDTFLSDADKGSREISGSIVGSKNVTKGSKERISGGGDSGDTIVKTKRSVDKQKGFGWAGTGTKEGKKVYTENKVDVTGPSVENVRGKITELEKDNPKGISMKSSAFKMKYSPFNQGFGSPLNWNERSPLNNLKKDDKLVPSTEGVYMKEGSSPLNQTEAECKSPKVWHNGKCWTEAAYKKEVSERVTDDDITETTTKTQQDLERGETSEREAEVKSKQKCTAADRKAALAKCTGDNDSKVCSDNPNCCYTCKKAKSEEELEETKKADVTCNDDEKKVKKEGGGYKCVKDTTEQDRLESEEVTARGTATVITSKTECDKKSGYIWKNGECVGEAGDVDVETKSKGGGSKSKCVRPKGGCDSGKRWDKDACKCIDKPVKEKEVKEEKEKTCPEGKQLIDGRCKRIKEPKEEKEKTCGKGKELVDGKCKRIKEPKDKDDCKCVKWDCE